MTHNIETSVTSSMKKTLLVLTTLSFLGAGCSNPLQPQPPVDTFGMSHFGTSRAIGGAGAPDGQFIEGGWVRPYPGPFWWDAIETAPGQFDWSRADQEVQFWNKKNQAMLVTVWPFAQWDQVKCHSSEPKVQDPFYDQQVWLSNVCNVDSFQRFVTELVERYDGDGTDDMPGLTHAVKHWEISNEPDTQTTDVKFFQSGPYAYAETLNFAYESIKAADSDAVVLPAGQSSMRENGISFFRQVLSFSRDKFDIGNIHSVSADEDFYAQAYRRFLNGLGFDMKPFWITEAVVGSPDTNLPWDEDQNARMTFVSYASAFANGAQRIFSFEHPDEKSQVTFEMMAETIGFFDNVDRIKDNAALFTVDDKQIFALWNDAELPGDYKDKKVDVLRYDGSRDKVDASTLKADVPMFVFVD